MRIDSHQHFWHYNSREYGWISDDMEILRKDYLPEQLESELSSAGFDGSVTVQARQSLAETKWLLDLAGKYDFIKGVVGWIDLCSPDAEEQIIQFSANTKLVGVRHVLHDEPDDNFMLSDSFLRGLSFLQRYGLAYDILVFPRHLSNTIQLVSQFPEQVFILDHIAKPLIRDRIISPWKEDIEKLAGFSNVWCKLSGMVTEANVKSWRQDDLIPYLDVVFNAFGTDRLLAGSDWPVCRLAGSYKQVMQVIMDYTRTMPDEERKKILGENAMKAYGLLH